ncbi:MAG: ROK family protein [Lachnospiraceae bacterium]|nr:ROK family protein [Lachnospiraceae bacterium]
MKKKNYLGFDIGGTGVKYAAVSEEGKFLTSGSFPSGMDMTREELTKQMSSLIERYIAEYRIAGVGISTLGIVNGEMGEVVSGAQNLPAIEGFNMREYFQKRFPGLKVAVMNDVHAAALGERVFGAARGCKHFFCVTFGTGLGGCAIVDSNRVYGSHYHAGEIGYLDYRDGGECCEKELSTGFVMHRAAKALGREQINGIEFFKLVKEGNVICTEIFEEWMGGIARLISNIVILLDPEKVILGGGISGQGDFILNPVREKLKTMMPEEFFRHMKVEMAQCANDAGILGAVSKWMK